MNLAELTTHYAQVKRRLMGSARREIGRIEHVPPLEPARPVGWRPIVDEVCAEYGVTFDDMRSARWSGGLNEARAKAFWRLKTEISVQGRVPHNAEIGRWFGGKDHSTVSLALKRYRETIG